uniref:Ion_trans_2 domain-containing protein n=1 Tax=Mesocestoides corti TaxID=53468 RepID=A0A5K3F4K7_MESCO
MIYALPGIPLCLVMFQSIGERINTLITRLLRRLVCILRCKSQSISQTHLIFVSANVVTIVLTAGAAVFAQYEKWHYLDALYYCFITLTTIGFGDFVALQREDSLAKRPDYVAFSLVFILFGLTVVSSVMNLLVLRFLTMNTDDQRRDDLEAAAQAQELRRLHGDVIHSFIGMTNHLPTNYGRDYASKSNAKQGFTKDIKEMSHSSKLPCENEAQSNSLPCDDTPQSAIKLHVEKYFRSFARLFSNDGHQNVDPPTKSFRQIAEGRIRTTASYSESESFEDEYSPWIYQSDKKPERNLIQHNLRFNDSCYRKLPRVSENVPSCTSGQGEIGSKKVAAPFLQHKEQRTMGADAKCYSRISPNTFDELSSDECESPPLKFFRYSSLDRASL